MSIEVEAGGGTTITPADAAVEFRGSCRALTFALADTDVGNTIQVIGDVGPLTITSAGSGDSSTINLYGHAQSVTDGSSGGTTVNNYMSGYVQTNAILTDTGTTIPGRLDTVDTSLADIPTVAEFNARTLVAASYFDPATDAVANVTLVATTTNSTQAETDIAALNNISTANVNTEMVDVMKTDTIAERTNGAPPTTPTFEQAISYLYMMLTDKIDIDSGFKEFYNNGGTIIWKKALTDDASNYIEANGQSGS